MSYFWCEFSDLSAGCIEADSSYEANLVAAKLGKAITRLDALPYPASPFLNASTDSCPPFCYTPRECRGNSCCRKRHACSE
jgi:hypothetical protein